MRILSSLWFFRLTLASAKQNVIQDTILPDNVELNCLVLEFRLPVNRLYLYCEKGTWNYFFVQCHKFANFIRNIWLLDILRGI